MNLFARAYQGLNLTPIERAFLKFIKGTGYSAVVAAFVAVSQSVGAHGAAVNWLWVILTGGGSMAGTLLVAGEKYWSAKGDQPLANLAGTLAQDVQQPVAAAPDPSAIRGAVQQHLTTLLPDIINVVLSEVRRLGAGPAAPSSQVVSNPAAPAASTPTAQAPSTSSGNPFGDSQLLKIVSPPS